MDELSSLKRANHMAKQTEKHVELMKANPKDEQYHLDSIALLLQDVMKALAEPRNKGK